MSPSKVNKKVIAQLSDSCSDEVVVQKSKKSAPKRKSSSSSESVELLKNKRKPSKDAKKKKPVQSDSESEAPKKSKKAAPKKKQIDSDDESSEVVTKKVTKKSAKVQDSDSESDAPRKQSKSKKKCDSSDEEVDTPMKNLNGNGHQQTADDGETHKEIFVRNLSYQSTEDSLWEYFSTFGKLVTLRILTDKMTGRSKGIGFIEFEQRSDALKAIEGCGEVDGRTPTCSWSNIKPERTGGDNNRGGFQQRGGHQGGFGDRGGFQKSNFSGDVHTIFVGNLGFRTNENTIKSFFSGCGSVVDVRIAKNEEGRAKGFCHVDFEQVDAIESAKKLAGQDLDGREIRVDGSNPRTGGSRGGFGGGRGGDRGGFRGGRGGNRGGPPRQQHTAGGNHKTFNDSD